MKGTIAAAVASAIALSSTGARAQQPRVLIESSTDFDVMPRVERELTAAGFQAIHSTGAGCSPAAVEERAKTENAGAAVCLDRSVVIVWALREEKLWLRDMFDLKGTNDLARDVVATRTAEVVRASFDTASPAILGPAPTISSLASEADRPELDSDPHSGAAAEIHDSQVGEKASAPPKPAPHTPAFTLGAGVGYLVGIDTNARTLSVSVSRRLTQRFGAFLQTEIPLDGHRNTYDRMFASGGTEVTAVVGETTTSPGLLMVGVDAPLARPTAMLVPRVGQSVGLAWLAHSTTAFADPPQRDTIFTWAMAAHGSLSLQLYGPARFKVLGSFGTTGAPLELREAGRSIVRWQSFGTLSAQLEAVLP